MSDTAEVTARAPAAPNPADSSASPTNIARYGHEPSRIAQPSTFLLPRGQNRAMQDKPLSAVDKDQLSGLVSDTLMADLMYRSCDGMDFKP
jgi:5'-AMP-activated protein kinase regulatory gamma subunit